MRADRSEPFASRRRVHIVGIGGAGMSALASVLADMGHSVSGSDRIASAVTARLADRGIAVVIGHAEPNLADADIVTASPAVAADNPELVEARRRGIPVLTRAAALAALSRQRRCAAVAGTHGKTTTSSMLTLCLEEGGLHPSFVIGADVGQLGTNGRLDDGEWLVLEADESYGSFAELAPELTVLTSVEPDHLDHYGSLEALQSAFGHLLDATTGPRLVAADDNGAAVLGWAVGATSVGEAEGSDYSVRDVVLAPGSIRFALGGPAGPLGVLSVPVPGRHNVANAALAASAALEIGVEFGAIEGALAGFAGVSRRYERRGEASGVRFVDDYGHLPGEIAPTLAAARLDAGSGRVVAVFQPHRFTRTAALAADFACAFEDADVVVITDIYAAGEAPIPGVSGRLVADAVRAQRGRELHYVADRAELRTLLLALLGPGDLCVTLGAGDLTTLPDELVAELSS